MFLVECVMCTYNVLCVPNGMVRYSLWNVLSVPNGMVR